MLGSPIAAPGFGMPPENPLAPLLALMHRRPPGIHYFGPGGSGVAHPGMGPGPLPPTMGGGAQGGHGLLTREEHGPLGGREGAHGLDLLPTLREAAGPQRGMEGLHAAEEPPGEPLAALLAFALEHANAGGPMGRRIGVNGGGPERHPHHSIGRPLARLAAGY